MLSFINPVFKTGQEYHEKKKTIHIKSSLDSVSDSLVDPHQVIISDQDGGEVLWYSTSLILAMMFANHVIA